MTQTEYCCDFLQLSVLLFLRGLCFIERWIICIPQIDTRRRTRYCALTHAVTQVIFATRQ